MKEYKIPILWGSYRVYTVQAENLEEAVTNALKDFLKEPDDNYLDDSFEVDSILDDAYPDETFDVHQIYNKL